MNSGWAAANSAAASSGLFQLQSGRGSRRADDFLHDAVGRDDVGARRHHGAVGFELGQDVRLGVVAVEQHEDGFARCNQGADFVDDVGRDRAALDERDQGSISCASMAARLCGRISMSMPMTRPRPMALNRLA